MQIGSKHLLLSDTRVASFRPAVSNDEPLLLELYGSARADELALTNWDEDQRKAFLKMQLNAQQAHYSRHYPEGEHLIILVAGCAVGRLYVANIEQEIRILDITILPEHRSAGMGTGILKELMAEAASIGKPLRIYVESYNASHRLFERLGFVKSGENGYSDLMEWRAEKDDQSIATS